MEFMKDVPMIRKSANKNNRYTSVENHVNRRNICLQIQAWKRERAVACDACRYYQNTHVTSHPTCSVNCTQRLNPNQYKYLTRAAEIKTKVDVVSQSAFSQAKSKIPS